MGNQYWETPWELFNKLDAAFAFTIDGAADNYNSKCQRYISEAENAFTTELHNERVFCNPPYANVDPWAKRFIRWRDTGNPVIALLQDKTDTIWFRKVWHESSQVRFLHGRVEFLGTRTGNMHGAVVFVLFPSNAITDSPYVDIWDWKTTAW